MDEFLDEIASDAELGCRSISVDIAEMFRNTNFFDNLKGRPEDLEAIKATLTSPGFFETPEHFNEHYRKSFTSLLAGCLQQVCFTLTPSIFAMSQR